MKKYTLAIYFLLFFIVLLIFSESFKLTQTSNITEGFRETPQQRDKRIKNEQFGPLPPPPPPPSSSKKSKCTIS